MVAHELEFSLKFGMSLIDSLIGLVSAAIAVLPFDVDATSEFALFSDWFGSSQLILNLVIRGSDANIFLVTYSNTNK